MKKKGFTLIELLATVALISIIVILLLPNLLNMVNNKKSSISDASRKMIYQATDLYVTENEASYSKDFLGNNKSYCIKLEDLVDSGKLSSPIKDMKTGKEIPLTYYVRVTLDEYNQFNYVLVDDDNCNPEIAYKIKNKNKYTKEKKITINYPNNNYEKKYKVISGTTKENIDLNTDITVTENPTITFTSNGAITFWIEKDNQVMSETTVNITKIDTTNPTLSLSKITYIEDDFSDWTLSNAIVTEEDGEKILTLGTNDTFAVSATKDFETNGKMWYPDYEAYTTTTCSSCAENSGGVHNTIKYLDENKESTQYMNHAENGVAFGAPLNKWTSSLVDSRYSSPFLGIDSNIKYIRFNFIINSSYSKPIVKIRNFKIYGEAIPNDFYLINVTANDNNEISEIKYAKGDKDIAYFKNYGERVNNNQIKVIQNGTYSVCAIDKAGNMTVEKIVINNIE